MDVKQHLSDQDWGELLKPAADAAEHLAQCASCRQEHEQLLQPVKELPEWARSAEEQPEVFWERQRLAIRSRIARESGSARRSTRLAWVVALAIILFASLILKTGSRVPVQRSQADPDHELLVAVEQALDGDVPEALQPASLLVDEMAKASQPDSNSRNSKEKSKHEK